MVKKRQTTGGALVKGMPQAQGLTACHGHTGATRLARLNTITANTVAGRNENVRNWQSTQACMATPCAATWPWQWCCTHSLQ